MKARTDAQVLARMLRKFTVDPNTGCHLWAGSKMANGYGQLGYQSKNAYAHRVSWMLQVGPIPQGLNVLHKCDVRACINPAHLFLGTAGDNVHDMMSKGRHNMGKHFKGQIFRNPLRGEAHGMARLVEGDISEIRKRYQGGEKQADLAREYGVVQPHISRIVRNTCWTSTTAIAE